MEEKRNHIVDITCNLLAESRVDSGQRLPSIQLLTGDGSQREFYRLSFDNDWTLIAVVPSDDQKQARQEAVSSWNIGKHLYSRDIPVPKPYGFDSVTGLVLFEDLGDVLLYDHVKEKAGNDDSSLFETYQQVVRVLVHMQISGRDGFDPSWCWQTKHYDRDLMLERESGYFLKALCTDFFGLVPERKKLWDEFDDIADHAAQAPADFFLHRDFQSRNIMIMNNKVRIIDFQGGRFGPLGYDLASLLLDPYIGLTSTLQNALVSEYIKVLDEYISYDPDLFRQEYYFLSLQRNLQILGAFAFLSKERKKDFFRPFIRPALKSLQSLLANPLDREYSALYKLTKQCIGACRT